MTAGTLLAIHLSLHVRHCTTVLGVSGEIDLRPQIHSNVLILQMKLEPERYSDLSPLYS